MLDTSHCHNEWERFSNNNNSSSKIQIYQIYLLTEQKLQKQPKLPSTSTAKWNERKMKKKQQKKEFYVNNKTDSSLIQLYLDLPW